MVDRSGLPFSRIRILKRLARHPLTVKEVAHSATIDAPAATVAVNDLEARGLVVRQTDPSNRRSKLVSLTDAGAAVVATIDTTDDPAPDVLADLEDVDLKTLRPSWTRSPGTERLSSAEVALDLVGRPDAGLPGIPARLTQGPALPQQIPALVERNLDGAKPVVLLGFGDLVMLELGPQILFLADEVADLGQGVAVAGFPSCATAPVCLMGSNAGMSLRSAIVTGASSGIGLAVAAMLHDEGFGVTMVARRAEKLDAAEQLVSSQPGPPVHALAGSVADETFLDSVVQFHTVTFGAVDLLMNNAGIAARLPVGEITAELLDEQYAVNTRAVILLTSKSLALLQAAVALRGTAQVVNTSSNAGKRGEANLSTYSATKAAVLGFTEALHQELSTSGIKATAICPGLVDTPMADDTSDVVSPAEMIAPRDIAEAVRMTTRLSASCTVPEIIMLRPTDWLLPPDA